MVSVAQSMIAEAFQLFPPPLLGDLEGEIFQTLYLVILSIELYNFIQFC